MKTVFKKANEVSAFYKSLPYWSQSDSATDTDDGLPTPEYLYKSLNILHEVNAKTEWQKVFCCFHEGHSKSLSLSMKSGRYICHSNKCNANGSMTDFVMKHLNISSAQAVKYLLLAGQEEKTDNHQQFD